MADTSGITDEEILKRFSVAVHEMLADEDLAKAMPQEFTITPDLAMKLQPVFPEWRVSAEWTSREDKHKRIAWNDEDGKLRSRPIRPDIIVHKAHTEINILVVEAKKATSKQKLDGDIEKLKLMTMQESSHPDYHYGYCIGVHLIVDLSEQRVTANDVYRNGAVDPQLTELLSALLS
nr:hypothetical protein [Mesorhizobium sp.]